MSTNRIIAVVLSLFLISLLLWSIVTGAGDVRTRITLGIGIALGLLYAIVGRVPDWIVDRSGGSITADDDPANLPLRVYLPILIVIMLLAMIAVAIVLFAM